jgi:hypothetical protein
MIIDSSTVAIMTSARVKPRSAQSLLVRASELLRGADIMGCGVKWLPNNLVLAGANALQVNG